jgi:hypothetical protein
MSWVAPRRLLGNHNQVAPTFRHTDVKQGKTVYTLRITTSPDRSATLSDTSSGVLVCLQNEEGDSLLRYIPCLENATEQDATLRDICAHADSIPPGADCSLIMGSPTPPAVTYSKYRFQSGAVSEVSFVGPNLGPGLSAVIVGPQSGTWGCSEVVVSSSADGGAVSSKFLSKDGHDVILGKDLLHSAAYMVRVPQGTVLYGEGKNARVLPASDALEMAAKNMIWYNEMKKKLLFYTATVGVVGMSLAYASLGPAAALSFASGSIASFWYQIGLQKKVDKIGSDAYEDEAAPSRLVSALPLVGVSIGAYLVYTNPSLLSVASIGSDNVGVGVNDNFSLTMALLAGFASQKLAIIIFSVEGVTYPMFDLENASVDYKQRNSSNPHDSSSK